MASISTDAQVRYLIQWFNEWSELQRSDFLPILAEKYSNQVYVNGIVNHIAAVNCEDKPMSLFECRVKLFKEWFVNWSPLHRENFLKQIKDIDEDYAKKLTSELQNGIADDQLQNGIADDQLQNGIADDQLQNGITDNQNHNTNNVEEVLED